MVLRKSNIKIVLLLSIIFGLWIIGFRCGRSRSVVRSTTVVVYDTTTVFVPMPSDTVVKWYAKWKWREVEPDTVVIFLYDSTVAYQLPPEMILTLDHTPAVTKFSTVVMENSTIEGFRRYSYSKLGSSFVIRPTLDGWHVRRRKALFSRRAIILGYSLADGAFLQGDLAVSRVGLRAEISAKGVEAEGDMRLYYLLW